MSVGSWSPEPGLVISDIDRAWLERFISWAENDQLEQLSELMTNEEQQSLAVLMFKDHSEWLHVTEPLSNTQLLALIRFFTLAENLPGWQAGEKSPVIPLARTLRKRGNKLDRELLMWMREANDNRYLPYGPL